MYLWYTINHWICIKDWMKQISTDRKFCSSYRIYCRIYQKLRNQFTSARIPGERLVSLVVWDLALPCSRVVSNEWAEGATWMASSIVSSLVVTETLCFLFVSPLSLRILSQDVENLKQARQIIKPIFAQGVACKTYGAMINTREMGECNNFRCETLQKKGWVGLNSEALHNTPEKKYLW